MQSNTFLIHKLRKKFLAQELIEFSTDLPQSILNIEDKTRSNIFTWRGQFSPQLIENLLLSYCPRDAHILDPFAASGTVIYEAACFGLPACGCELNPAAWILTRTYQLINLPSAKRDRLIISIAERLENYFPKPKIFEYFEIDEISYAKLQNFINDLYTETDYIEKIILDAFVILLDLANHKLTTSHVHKTFYKLCQAIKNFPESEAPIASLLCDARSLPVEYYARYMLR
ncbi:MAG TPA: hypothetical protein DDW76_18460 [Cyanobacteria bacterium UBA11369]|nr:hypothetical protein [Cyanobacteria bacterium UBA11371]HBE35479.1 hypothetical protein [Cyanobacteria bacterium UBA11368]HBE50697.1 hypothetical protein [Cyanobacteria bacterium UBA11369]